MNDIKLSFGQIEKMKHAIGLGYKNMKKDRYCAYRNRYIVSKPDNDWEELVSIGYATKREFEIEKQIIDFLNQIRFSLVEILSMYQCLRWT